MHKQEINNKKHITVIKDTKDAIFTEKVVKQKKEMKNL